MILTYGTERIQWKTESTESTGVQMHDLPVELVVEILKCLDFRDILRYQAVRPIYLVLLARSV